MVILDVLSDILVGVAVGSSTIADTFSVIVINPSIVCTWSDVGPDVFNGMFSVVARLSEDVVSAEVTGEESNVEAGDGVMFIVVESSDVVSSEVGTDVRLVVSGGLGADDDVVGIVGGEMTMSGGHVGLLPQKVTSAKYTQSETRKRKNRRVNIRTVVLAAKHNLTGESQEVMLGLVIANARCPINA